MTEPATIDSETQFRQPFLARSGLGYWLTASDGGVFNADGALFLGSMRAEPSPDRQITRARWWPHGDRHDRRRRRPIGQRGGHSGRAIGEHPAVGAGQPVAGAIGRRSDTDDRLFAFGSAPFGGSLGSSPPASPVVGYQPRPQADTGTGWRRRTVRCLRSVTPTSSGADQASRSTCRVRVALALAFTLARTAAPRPR